MIDELDAFNAQITLAVAHAGRFPGKSDPFLAGQAKQLTRLQRHSLGRVGEKEAFKDIFGRAKGGMTILYQRFYQHFLFEPEFVRKRIVVNSPPGVVFPKATTGQLVEVNLDPRFGAVTHIPDLIALNVFERGTVDDITFYSDDGLSPADSLVLSNMVAAEGGTFTFLRPNERCEWWFAACNVKHSFQEYLGTVGGKIQHVFTSHPNDPISVTVLGVNLDNE